MVKYDYEKFFSVVEFDFFDNPDLAMYVEDVHLDSVTPDSVIIKINFTLYGDIIKENIDDWEEMFMEDSDTTCLEALKLILNVYDRLVYSVKQTMKFYFDKDAIDDIIIRGNRGESGAVELQDILRMIVTVNYESSISNANVKVKKEILDAFDDGVGFPIPEDVDALSGDLQFGV